MKIGNIDKFILHFIGNKKNGDGVKFSNKLSDHSDIESHINQLVDNSFNFEDIYQFYFQPSLELNPIYRFTNLIFEHKESFLEQSQNIGRLLYDKSNHPKIKAGELCVIYFKNCSVNNEIVDCIGLFKSETKSTILKINNIEEGLGLTEEKGISTNKLDKACLIFNTNKETGYLVSVIDNTNKGSEAQYWKSDFLGIKQIKNEFHQTKNFLGITKQFITKKLSEDFDVVKADQIDFLNRSVNYFKNHEKFNKQDFEDKVFEDSEIIESFQHFNQTYSHENKIEIPNNFNISKKAVSKQARVFKSVLKLDKNFHIYIHGNRNLIERGIDEKGRKFYKIFYDEEK